VIAALYYPSGGVSELVRADGDDPSVTQEALKQLKRGHAAERSNGSSSLDQKKILGSDSRSESVITKSRVFTECSLARCDTHVSKRKERCMRMQEDELYLRTDSRFWSIVEKIKFLPPGAERTKAVDDFWASACQNYYRSEVDLIRARCRVPSEVISLRDEVFSDEDKSCGLDFERSSGPIHVVDGGGDTPQAQEGDRSSLVQIRRFRAS
jgi:hypothetical protein